MERNVTRGFNSKKTAAVLGVPEVQEDREGAWCAGVDSCRGCARTATCHVAQHRSDRVVRRLVCPSCVPCMFSFDISRIGRVICASCSVGLMKKNQERVLVPQMLINAWIPVEPCCTIASVRKCLQASGIERNRRSVHEYMAAEHWPAKQVIRG